MVKSRAQMAMANLLIQQVTRQRAEAKSDAFSPKGGREIKGSIGHLLYQNRF
jgi:hypothetical protein